MRDPGLYIATGCPFTFGSRARSRPFFPYLFEDGVKVASSRGHCRPLPLTYHLSSRVTDERLRWYLLLHVVLAGADNGCIETASRVITRIFEHLESLTNRLPTKRLSFP
jgi:hypothetical protein